MKEAGKMNKTDSIEDKIAGAWNETYESIERLLKEDTLKCEFYYNLRNKLGDDYVITTEFYVNKNYINPKEGKTRGEFIDMLIMKKHNSNHDLWAPEHNNIVAYIEIKYLTRAYIQKSKAVDMIQSDLDKLSRIIDYSGKTYMLYVWEYYNDEDEILPIRPLTSKILPHPRKIM